MQFIQHYSSSAGNFYEVVAASGERLLIDPGVSWAKLQAALKFNLKDIKGCLVSHSHGDHSYSAMNVMLAGIDVFADEDTLIELDLLGERRACRIIPRCPVYNLAPFFVKPWATIHDALGAMYFEIKCDGERLLFATDTQHIPQKFLYPFDIIAIECNYTEPLLARNEEMGHINEAAATRIRKYHQSREVVIRYLKEFCDLSKLKELHLLHMSDGNIDKEKTVKEFEDEFMVKVVTV